MKLEKKSILTLLLDIKKEFNFVYSFTLSV
jgi:hypothetical protein